MAPSIRRTLLVVAILYLAVSAVVFRKVIASLPQVLRGEAVIGADELVPYFNPTSQLIDQAAGKFNSITHGYEFRVRYSILTTWLRYYKLLPFALVLVIPGVTFAAYLGIARLLARAFPQVRPEAVYRYSVAPVLMIFLIMVYCKITSFYTLIVGFALFVLAIAWMVYGLILAERRPYLPILLACLVTLFNPAVHYLVLFGLFLVLSIATLLALDLLAAFRYGTWREGVERPAGGRRRLLLPSRFWRSLFAFVLYALLTLVPSYRGSGRDLLRPRRWREGTDGPARGWRRLFVQSRFWRCVWAFVLFVLVTLVPYYLFVTLYVTRGVGNLSENVPADYYFIQDASMSPGHLLSLDMAGIMDKVLTGDYLARQPRWINTLYTLLMFAPLAVRRARRALFGNPGRRTLAAVLYVNLLFSMWASLGYTEPAWLPTFHRVAAFISNAANGTQSFLGGLVVKLMGTVVQILRFPHRFELLTFAMAALLIPIGWIWALQAVPARPPRGKAESRPPGALPGRVRSAPSASASLAAGLLFLLPFFSNASYRQVLFSGDLSGFLAAYPVDPLREVKDALLQLPAGKTIVLPPVESGKPARDVAGREHKFIDKFYLYFLDRPSYYYGLTGDPGNKNQFFLLLRALYYEQSWWVNVARDLDIRYLVVNKELVANPVGGQEYLRGMEFLLEPEFDRRSAYLTKLMENESFVLYEFTDLPQAERIPLYLATDWNSFIRILSANPELTRYYDLRYPEVPGDLDSFDRLDLVTDDPQAAALDLYIKANEAQFFSTSSTIMPFNPGLISSAYYLSPMFRLFQFFSDSKYNRLNLITPGLWGTVEGGFTGVPQATGFRIDIRLPEDGQYRLLLRGAAAGNELHVTSSLLETPLDLVLSSAADNLSFYDKRLVFTSQRTPLDLDSYSLEELSRLIPTDVVAINFQYQYFDLGTVSERRGSYTLFFDKRDAAPLLVEGILVIPEQEYRDLGLPANVQLVDGSQLCCNSIIVQDQMP